MEVDDYEHNYSKYKNRRVSNKDEINKIESVDNYLRIWKTNPSHKDIKTNISKFKAIFLVSLITFFMIGTYFITSNLFIALAISLLTLISFILIFHDNFFCLKDFYSLHFRKFVALNPFKSFSFFFFKEDKSTLFFSNKKDLTTVALRIFKIAVMPENVEPALNQFIKSLDEEKIPYTYQVLQKPLLSNINAENNSASSLSINILFNIFQNVNGILSYRKIKELNNSIQICSEFLKSSFFSNFHHFKIQILSENELLDALRYYVLEIDYSQKNDEPSYDTFDFKQINSQVLLKLFLIGFIIVYSVILLVIIKTSLTVISLIICVEISALILIWWREVLYQITILNLKNNHKCESFNPFEGVDFYYFNKFPDSLFCLINNKMLIGVKSYNLIYASPRLYTNKIPFCFPDKFFKALIGQKIAFSYTVMLEPINYYEFDKEGYKYLKERAKLWLYRDVDNEKKAKEWLDMRTGIWRTVLNISAFSFLYVNTLKMESVKQLEKKLKLKALTLKNAFKVNFQNFELMPLKKNKLISGFLCEILKNKEFRLNGTHLNYLLFQGKAIKQITRISRLFKKGVENMIAAEFNTPLQLENLITFGKTIDTEFLEEEVPAGITLDQAYNLLLTNGTSKNREALAMKIVSELIIAGIPSIVFDFTGNWSKLIKYFKDSRYENELLHFKLGTSFNIDPTHSEIPYDKKNIDYLDYMFDAYQMSFKKKESDMAIFKNTILRNPELDISQLNLELKSRQDWQKNFNTNAITVFFDEFTQLDHTLFQTSSIDLNEKINVIDFIQNDKTIIVDLSISNELKKKVFITFVILSKIIHFINNNNNFSSKIILIPHIDLMFDENYVDKNVNYGKIEKFLKPLCENDFGLITTSNQVHYLHPDLFNYFQNLIVFKSIDNKDISKLKYLLRLDEFFGQGYYSPTRNTTYQSSFLISMKPNEAIMKRSDIYQSFPVKLDIEEFTEMTPLKHEKIVEFMKRQGYDLKTIEQHLLELTKKTIFEKDFGIYSNFRDEIEKFLSALKKVDNIALYERKIKEELQKSIYEKAIKFTQNKKQINIIRDKVFDILVKHGYLIENHPKHAGGSEAMITCYSVGPQFEKALKDTFDNKNKISTNVSVETLNNEAKKTPNFDEKFSYEQSNNLDNFDKEKFKDLLAKVLYEKYYNLFNVYKYLNRKKFIKALNIERKIMREFLIDLYKEIYNVNYVITDKDLGDFVERISKIADFPFEKHKLLSHLEKCDKMDLNIENPEMKAQEFYNFLSTFFNTIQESIIKT